MFANLISGAIEQRNTDLLNNPAVWTPQYGGGVESNTGIKVDEQAALSSTAVWCAVRNLSEMAAMLPLHLYERISTEPPEKRRAEDHPLYWVLRQDPNPLQTSFKFREMMQAQLLIRGSAYAEIVYSNGGDVLELWPLHAHRMEVFSERGDIFYRLRNTDGTTIVFPRWKIFHISGFALDGMIGLVPHEIMPDAIGTGLALERYHAEFFGNDASPGGVLEHPLSMSEKAEKRFREGWQASHGEWGKKHRVALLEDGMTWKQTGVSPEDAQALEGRKFQIDEVCRIFNIAPHRLFELSRSTNNNIEEQGIEFRTYTAMPWLSRWEQQIGKDLLSDEERKRFYAEFMTQALERGNMQTRKDFYTAMMNWGAMSPNEVRSRENMNPRSDGLGDEYLRPVNMVVAGQEPEPEPKPQTIGGGDGDDKDSNTA